MLACVMYGLLGNAGIDFVDLDVNEAGMRLSLRITSWSEAGERLRSRVASWGGQTCTAGTDSAHWRVCPGGSFGGVVASAQRFLCSTGPDEWEHVVVSVNPISPGQDCCCRGTRDQEKFRNGAWSFKEQQKRATVLRIDLLSQRLQQLETQVGQQRVAIEHQHEQLMHQQSTIDANRATRTPVAPGSRRKLG